MNENGWQIFVEVPGRAPVELGLGEAVIGRSRSCAVQIAETTVSRQHAVFVVEPGTVRLKDLGSSNGTYVNGKRVDGTQVLGDGDRVVVGEAELIVRILAPLGPAEPTQRLVLPPLASPVASPGASPAPSAFRRTPTGVVLAPGDLPLGGDVASPPPLVGVNARVSPPPMPLPIPLSSKPPSPALPPLPSTAPATPAPARGERPGLAGGKAGELLGSIQEIDSVPIPPAAVRKAPIADRVERAGFWIRVAATLLDYLPIAMILVLGFALALFLPPEAAFLVFPLQVVLLMGYGLLISLVLPALKGATPGKKLLKLAIVTDRTSPGQGLGWGTAALRLVGHMVCSMTFSLGYLLVAFTAQKQGLHDLIAKTYVVRRK